MGTVWAMGTSVETTGAQIENLYIEVPKGTYLVSGPMTQPERILCNGVMWEKYEAHVLDRVTIWRECDGGK